MKKQLAKFALTAALALAITLTFSCSSGGVSSSSSGGGGDTEGSSSSSGDATASSSSSSDIAASSSSVESGASSSSAAVPVAISSSSSACVTNSATEQCCGSTKYTTATQFCYSGKIVSFCGARTETFDPDLYECRAGTNPNGIYLKAGITDSRDGTSKTYNAVLIGGKTWMAENLNYNASGSKCYSNSDANCDKYGRLYDWETAMYNSVNPSGVQSVCPPDWHLPSDAEWEALIQFVNCATGTCAGVGTKLKATTGWDSYYGVPAGTGRLWLCGSSGRLRQLGWHFRQCRLPRLLVECE